MDITNIILWTVSLTLAALGISFGIIASINSTKANKQIKELVADQMVAEEASKYFYAMLQKMNIQNKNTLKKLKGKTPVKYNDYAIMASQTRMAPLPKRVEKYLYNTEYADLTRHYIDCKVRLDAMFESSFNGYEILATTNNILKDERQKLIKYHEQMTIEYNSILKEYYTISKG